MHFLIMMPQYFVQSVSGAPQGEVSFLQWNQKVQNILASTSYNGTTGEQEKKLPFLYASTINLQGLFNIMLS